MTPRDFVREVRDRLDDPIDVVARLGLLDGSKRSSGGVTIRCPVHNEKSASCSVTRGPDRTIRFRCFSCGASGDVLHLIAAVRGLDIRDRWRDVIEAAAELAGVALENSASRPGVSPRRPRRPDPYALVDRLGEDWLASRPIHPAPEEEAFLARLDELQLARIFGTLAEADAIEAERLEAQQDALERMEVPSWRTTAA